MFNAARAIWQNFADSGWPLPAGGADGNGDRSEGDSDTDTDSDAMSYGGFYEPSYADVLVAKAMLQRCGGLPLELVDDIVDMAEYWPKTHVEVDFYENRRNGIFVPPRQSRNTGKNQFILRTPPLGFRAPPARGEEKKENDYSTKEPEPWPSRNDGDEVNKAAPGRAADSGVLCSDDDVRTWFPVGQAPPLEHPCRKIVFTLISHDQGWANNQRDRGSFKGSYSWFDVGLERYGVPGDKKDETKKEKDEETEPKDQKPEFNAVPPAASLYTLRPDVVEATEQSPTFHGQPTSSSMTQEPKRYQFSFPLLPGVDRLQSNRVATSAWTEYNIVWSWTDRKEDWDEKTSVETAPEAEHASSTDATYGGGEGEAEAEVHPLEKIGRGAETGNGEFVRNLRVGDVVTLWAKARFPGWVNMVQRAEIDVYWAV
ncbi:hypothetical protein Sste5346_005590 [Sporothrix stenoceras]|uniref:Uncharacterized protein n=1 Tax=Sporothrix stenoceras TaxID=5173 RepID=A0ABR3Z2X3_9PEZI